MFDRPLRLVALMVAAETARETGSFGPARPHPGWGRICLEVMSDVV